ncbi:MICAL-like protein 1 [Osmerus eperlanus]|uniref:MICAL-like protein 1 n=1 Tax=Osmerus eperlanus TaxID=29151 RepID=UPI002E12EEF9
MGSLKALQDWCRIECENYPNVDIRNMSTSFRDGLAFCALIHKHRPDLIDFHSLSKENVYENNHLAFEVAASKLGIPALLDPGDMVATDAPDRLSVITYLSQYYLVFNNLPQAGLTRLKVSYVGVDPTHIFTKQPAFFPDLEPATSSSGGQSGKSHQSAAAHHSGGSRLTGECISCRKHVHLLQRQLVEGQLYHRGCFRCGLCSSTLLPGSYREGEEPGSLVCSHHCSASQSTRPDLSRQEEAGSMEHLPKVVTQEVTSQRDARLPPHAEGPPREAGAGSTDPSPAPGATSAPQGGSSRPVPAPRRMLDSSACAPRPAPRTRAGKALDSSAAGMSADKRKSPPSTSSAGGSCRPKDHPWMCFSNPGPWTRLPPAPPPNKPSPSRSSSLSPLHGTGEWFWKKPTPGNPFGEHDDTDEEGSRTGAAGHGQNSMATSQSWSDARSLAKAAKGSDSANAGPVSREDAKIPAGHGSCPASTGARAKSAVPGKAAEDKLGRSGSAGSGEATHSAKNPSEATNDIHLASAVPHSKACKENLLDREAPPFGIPKSKTFQVTTATRAAAPGHGFPLIKRKVQADRVSPVQELQGEMGELEKQMVILELRGSELEGRLRGCISDQDEEDMLVDWFRLVQDKHKLVRRDAELVYLTKQNYLEERQADVEYELRCLLNKPESEWSKDDRNQEHQLMDELVTVIEQRNHIINSLEQDRQREKEEDLLLDAMIKRKDFQKEGEKERKKSKVKFKPLKVLMMLGRKAEDSKTKDSQKKS